MRRISDFATKSIFFIPGFWLLVFFLIPLSFVWIYSFSEVHNIIDFKLTWTLSNYIESFKAVYLGIIYKSLWIATATTLICLFFGLIVAIYITFQTSSTIKNLLLILVVLPFWTNILIRTYAMIAVLRTNGVINKIYEYAWNFFVPIFSDDLEFSPLALLYNNTAVVFGLVYVHLPFMILPLFGALEKLDRSLLEASFDLGAGRIKTLFKIVLPRIREGVYAGLLITFIPALGSFLTPDLLGGNDSQMIANVIERQFKSANNWPFGAALSFLLMYLLFFMVAFRSFRGRNGKNNN